MKILTCYKPTHLRPGTTFFLPLIGGILILTGCHKQPTPVAATPPPATETAPTAPAAAAAPNRPAYIPPTGPAPTVASAASGGADLKQLNHVYFSWIARTHQRVKTFEEFQTASGVEVPPPPEGKKYIIDHNGFINIASR